MPNQPAPHRQPIDLYVDCVVLSSFHSEFTFLQNVFRPTGIRMHYAESLDQADFLLTVTESTVLLTDVIFADGTWQSALMLLSGRHSLVTMLVIADPVDQPFLKDAFSRGACGVLWKPFDFEAVRRLIRAVHEASKERRALHSETSSGPGQREAAPSIATSEVGHSGVHGCQNITQAKRPQQDVEPSTADEFAPQAFLGRRRQQQDRRALPGTHQPFHG